MSLAYRNLFQDKIRLTLSVAGVALATVLILLVIAGASAMPPIRQIAELDPAMAFRGGKVQ